MMAPMHRLDSSIRGKHVYLSGPVTGVDNYAEKFNEAARFCASLGAAWTFNPAVEVDPASDWNVAMAQCIAVLGETRLSQGAMTPRFDTILLLPGWQSSKGASVEVKVADALGIDVVEYEPDYDIELFGHACASADSALCARKTSDVRVKALTEFVNDASYDMANVMKLFSDPALQSNVKLALASVIDMIEPLPRDVSGNVIKVGDYVETTNYGVREVVAITFRDVVFKTDDGLKCNRTTNIRRVDKPNACKSSDSAEQIIDDAVMAGASGVATPTKKAALVKRIYNVCEGRR